MDTITNTHVGIRSVPQQRLAGVPYDVFIENLKRDKQKAELQFLKVLLQQSMTAYALRFLKACQPALRIVFTTTPNALNLGSAFLPEAMRHI